MIECNIMVKRGSFELTTYGKNNIYPSDSVWLFSGTDTQQTD